MRKGNFAQAAQIPRDSSTDRHGFYRNEENEEAERRGSGVRSTGGRFLFGGGGGGAEADVFAGVAGRTVAVDGAHKGPIGEDRK